MELSELSELRTEIEPFREVVSSCRGTVTPPPISIRLKSFARVPNERSMLLDCMFDVEEF